MKLKRIVSAVLAVVVAVSSLSISTYAADIPASSCWDTLSQIPEDARSQGDIYSDFDSNGKEYWTIHKKLTMGKTDKNNLSLSRSGYTHYSLELENKCDITINVKCSASNYGLSFYNWSNGEQAQCAGFDNISGTGRLSYGNFLFTPDKSKGYYSGELYYNDVGSGEYIILVFTNSEKGNNDSIEITVNYSDGKNQGNSQISKDTTDIPAGTVWDSYSDVPSEAFDGGHVSMSSEVNNRIMFIKSLADGKSDTSSFSINDVETLWYEIELKSGGTVNLDITSNVSNTHLYIIDDKTGVVDLSQSSLEIKYGTTSTLNVGVGALRLVWDKEKGGFSGTLSLELDKGVYRLTVGQMGYEIGEPIDGKGEIFYKEGTGEFSIKASYPGTVLAAPTTVKASTVSPTSIKLTWKSTADSFNIYRATSKSGTYKKIGTSETASYTDKGLTKGKTYYYKVTAVSGGKESEFSKIVSAKACAPAPTSVKAAKSADGKAKLTWKKASGAEGYEIFMAESSGGKFSKIKTVTKGTTIGVTKSGLTSGKTYYFKVRSYITVNGKKVYSGYSKTVKVKV